MIPDRENVQKLAKIGQILILQFSGSFLEFSQPRVIGLISSLLHLIRQLETQAQTLTFVIMEYLNYCSHYFFFFFYNLDLGSRNSACRLNTQNKIIQGALDNLIYYILGLICLLLIHIAISAISCQIFIL